MTEHSSWKFAGWPEIEPVVQKWSADAWEWNLEAISASLTDLGWTPRKNARSMVLFTTDLSPATEAVLRLDNADNTVVRSVAIAVTSVVTAHESNTRKAKTFLADSHAATVASLQEAQGEPAVSDETTSQWDLTNGHIVVVFTNRSVRMTFYSPTGLQQADAAAKAKAATIGVEKKKKAPAPWRVAKS